ncbi:carbohydrate kinase family protein [Alloscardovia macacae]|uniref:2-dehydro-3-deoxygluconokinase n=1 Tax=Alloscardovia macacae TaxID=1160091 RepID=A0A261F2D1_9BIFI|nr:carbohydrate kinase [Alloscardovia macacae]OZG53076.1 2-dehydro-3-deoxygluconokinase [Alloscardovia macacae]
MTQPIVVSLGEILWDMLPEGKRAGGAPVNFTYHAAQNGLVGRSISAIGNDSLGDELEAAVKNAGIDAILQRNDYPTGTVGVVLNDGIPSYEIVQGVAWDHVALTDELIEAVSEADAVCYGSLACRDEESKNTILELLKHTKPGALKYYDINIRGDFFSKELIEAQLEAATVFKINDDELELLRPMFGVEGSDEEACAWFIKHYDLDYMILTGGSQFSIIMKRDGETSYVKTPRIKVADTVGAGDSFSGAFTSEILKGSSLHDAHIYACNVAAYVCTQSGAWPEYPAEIPNYVHQQGLDK